MKKFLFVVIALCLIVFPVFAETEEVQVITWDEAEEAFTENGYHGLIYSFDKLGFEMMIPDGLEMAELTEEMFYDRGIMSVFIDESGTRQVVVELSNLYCETLDEVADMVSENVGDAQFAYAQINGLNALLFTNPGEDSVTCVLNAGDGYFVQVTVSPSEDEYMHAMTNYIFASIRPIEE
ncbi:MAG: hypothetical protein IJI07_12625 [Flexilinea sp.]|nr:hypothetical protein [Flexilinea sp.]